MAERATGQPGSERRREPRVRVERLLEQPIIRPRMDARMGDNINGPSLIAVPDWLPEPLGRYYLYFADHKGTYIRLAYADQLTGPWSTYGPGALALRDSLYPTEASAPAYAHIASPDVHVDRVERRLRMYYHGLLEDRTQRSRVAESGDGLRFTAREEVIALPYLRMFRWQGRHYGMAMPGVFYRSGDGLSGFERGPVLFERDMRHAALLVRDDVLHVFWTRVGDAPERILHSTVGLTPDWNDWTASLPDDVLAPELDWEGAGLPVGPSVRGAISKPENQLRDPCVYVEGERVYLLYAGAGESGIGLAEVHF